MRTAIAVSLSALLCACAPVKPPEADLPLPPRSAGSESRHAVHNRSLRRMMRHLPDLEFQRLPQELGGTPRFSLAEAAQTASELAEAADKIAAAAPNTGLSEEEQAEFVELAGELRFRALRLEEDASQGRRNAIRSRMEEIQSTCVHCHELFREQSAGDRPR